MRARVRWPQANLFAVLVFSGLRFGDFALAQPVAFAVHLEAMDVVGQAIENGACEAFCAEDLGPFIERQVGCDDDGAAFVALRDDLEEKLGPGLAQWHKTQFINDQQVLADQLFLQALQAAFVDGLDEFMDESSGSGEAYFPALLAGRQTQSQGDMGFTCAAWPQCDDIGAPVYELTAGQLHGQDLVQRRDDLEVEAVQAFGRRELCGLDPALDHPAFALDQFQLAKPQQVVDVILVLHCALPGLFGIFAVEGRQPELLEVVLQQNLRGVGHAGACAIRLM